MECYFFTVIMRIILHEKFQSHTEFSLNLVFIADIFIGFNQLIVTEFNVLIYKFEIVTLYK